MQRAIKLIVLFFVAPLVAACVSDTGGTPFRFHVRSDGAAELWSDLGNTVVRANTSGFADVETLDGFPLRSIAWAEPGVMVHVDELELLESYGEGELVPAAARPFLLPLFAPLTPEDFGILFDPPVAP